VKALLRARPSSALRASLLPGGALTRDDLLVLALGAARGVAALHAERIVHRDLACRNLLVHRVDGRVPRPRRCSRPGTR